MKKTISALVCVLLLTAASTTVFAHGHGYSRYKYIQKSAPRSLAVNYTVCGIQDCVITGLHEHSSRTYASHYYGDGHKYHGYCGIEECTIAGYHEHDGVYCFGHTFNDGHIYHEYCSVANCGLTGYHEHNGSYCFAHTINDGHRHHNTVGFH